MESIPEWREQSTSQRIKEATIVRVQHRTQPSEFENDDTWQIMWEGGIYEATASVAIKDQPWPLTLSIPFQKTQKYINPITYSKQQMITRRGISFLCVSLLSVLSFAKAEDTKKEYGTVIGIGESFYQSINPSNITCNPLFLIYFYRTDLGTTYSAVGYACHLINQFPRKKTPSLPHFSHLTRWWDIRVETDWLRP